MEELSPAIKELCSTEIKGALRLARNRRSDAMFVGAFMAVGSLVYVVVFIKGISEYAQGVITLVLGAFVGYLTAMYNFETGTTRGAEAKDDTIKDMANSSINATEQRHISSETVLQEIAKTVPAAAAAMAAANGSNGRPVVTPAPATASGVIPAAEVKKPAEQNPEAGKA